MLNRQLALETVDFEADPRIVEVVLRVGRYIVAIREGAHDIDAGSGKDRADEPDLQHATTGISAQATIHLERGPNGPDRPNAAAGRLRSVASHNAIAGSRRTGRSRCLGFGLQPADSGPVGAIRRNARSMPPT